MSDSTNLVWSCGLRHLTNSSTVWRSNCGDGLCVDCNNIIAFSIELHNSCKEIIEMKDYIKDVKLSARFSEFEERLSETSQIIKESVETGRKI